MRRVTLLAIIVAVGLFTSFSWSDAKIDEQIVGPVSKDARYAVSPRGAHLATVIGKGSRFVVIVDGVEGPKFDEIVAPTAPFVDPRPMLEAQRAESLDLQRSGAAPPPASDFSRPVIFSADGKHHAYVGRLGQEWVLMADGKEVMRVPGSGGAARATIAGDQGSVALRMEFTGEDGKHLMFAKSVVSRESDSAVGASNTFSGYELWVDGKQMPGTYASGGTSNNDLIDPIISRDGQHFAYVAQIDREKRTVILDGNDAGYLADNLHFSADDQHLIGVRRAPNEQQQVLMDGKPVFGAANIQSICVAPVGAKIVALAMEQGQSGSQSAWLIVDGNKIDASVGENISNVIFSPDGAHYAAICGRASAQFVVHDGKKGQEYFKIDETMTFSADSQKLGYVAWVAPKRFVVINEDESDAFDGSVNFCFSPDGKRVAYCGAQQGSFALYVDGKLQRRDPRSRLANFLFSPDGSRFAFSAGDGILLDGQPIGVSGERMLFSPDSKHFAVWGESRTAAARGVFVNAKHVYGRTGNVNVRFRAFTPDSQHFFWMAFEQTNQPAQSIDNALYLDGKVMARCDRIDSSTFKDIYDPGNYPFIAGPAAWNVGDDGALTFLAPMGEAIKRVTITPTAETNIASMMAAAEAAASQPATEKPARELTPREKKRQERQQGSKPKN